VNTDADGSGLIIAAGTSAKYPLRIYDNGYTNELFNIRSNGNIYAYGLSSATSDTVLYINGGLITRGLAGAGSGGDEVSVDGVATTNPNFTSTGDVDFVNTSNTITANINADAIEYNMLNDNIISSQTALTSGLASTDELMVSDAGTVKKMDVSVLETYMQDNLSFGGVNMTVQSLSGTTVFWNMTNGINAEITLSASVTIDLSNVPTGYSGNLTVTNASTAYTISFLVDVPTYDFKISPSLNSSNGGITMSGGSVVDVLSWYYDGTYIFINGTLNYDDD
jgi:hypothetical protein